MLAITGHATVFQSVIGALREKPIGIQIHETAMETGTSCCCSPVSALAQPKKRNNDASRESPSRRVGLHGRERGNRCANESRHQPHIGNDRPMWESATPVTHSSCTIHCALTHPPCRGDKVRAIANLIGESGERAKQPLPDFLARMSHNQVPQ